jgi:putative transposase
MGHPTHLLRYYISTMPSGLKRFHGEGHYHFLTFSCYRRLPYLYNDPARIVFEELLERVRKKHDFYLFGYVLMPEHVHLLLSEPKLQRLEDTIRVLKGETSKRLKGDRKQFWQRRYHDFNVFTHDKFVEKLRYMHRNPVERGLVEAPEDWPWSSCNHWLTGLQGRFEIESEWTWNRRHRERSHSLTAKWSLTLIGRGHPLMPQVRGHEWGTRHRVASVI